MNKLIINIVLPFPVTKPVGGAKIMYEYANRLQQNGHTVSIFHSIKRPFKKSNTPLWYKQLVFALRGVARPKWFELNKEIKSCIVPEITDRYLPDADIVISTWWQMTYAVAALSPSKGKKFNLIQDYEIWAGHQEKVDASFSLPVNHLVIARYLQKMIAAKNNGIDPILIPNAIDNNKFSIKISPASRDPFSVIMLYSEEPRKDSASGINALKLLQHEFPQLKVQLFGVYPMPEGLSQFIHYVQKPENLCDLYNEAAIFLSPSLTEGFGLPAAEAMACGCAVVCTNVGGHPDFAIHLQTALLVRPAEVDDMVEKITLLFRENQLRLKLATEGNKLITTSFNWIHSVQLMESCFYNSLMK